MIGRLALVLGLGTATAGCNQVFGLDPTVAAPGGDDVIDVDLDLDGIPDDRDSCLAAAADLTQDEDYDGLPNGDDPCPLDDTTQAPLDTDSDGVTDLCDPFPSHGDTKRCAMMFNNPDLTMRLWHESDGLMKWGTTAGDLHTVDGQGVTNIASTIRIDGSAQPTYDVSMIANASSAAFYTVRVWARASDPATPNDVGCELAGDANHVRVAVVLGDGRDFGARTLVGTPFPVGIGLRIRMSVGPDALSPNMRCSFAWEFQRHTVTAPLVLPVGEVGFGTEDTQVSITGLVVYDRDDVQPYP